MTNAFGRLANGTVAKMAGVALMAGAVALVAPHKADAQVRFGVSVGIPVHAGPVYGRPVYGPPVVYGGPRYVSPGPVYGGYYDGFYGPHHLSHDEWFRQQGYWQREHGYR